MSHPLLHSAISSSPVIAGFINDGPGFELPMVSLGERLLYDESQGGAIDEYADPSATAVFERLRWRHGGGAITIADARR